MVSYLQYKRQTGGIERHEDDVVDDYAEACEGAEDLEPSDTGQRANTDQQCFHEGVQSDGRSQQGHAARDIRPDLLLAARAQRVLSQRRGLGKVDEK